MSLHKSGIPNMFLKIIYYITFIVPVSETDLVDSLEIFSGCAAYTKAPVLQMAVLTTS